MNFIYTKNPRPAEQVGDFTFNKTNCLRDLNGLGDFLLRCGLRHGDGQDAVLHLGRDLVTNHIIRQLVVLLVVRVAELTAQIVMVLVLMLVFLFVLNGDGEVALVIDGYAAICSLMHAQKKQRFCQDGVPSSRVLRVLLRRLPLQYVGSRPSTAV